MPTVIRKNSNIQIKAVATNRPEVLSGWDMELNQPKPTKRYARAGSVYFISLEKLNKQEREEWINKTWFNNVSDDEQSNRDGFGLAILGTWEGVPDV